MQQKKRRRLSSPGVLDASAANSQQHSSELDDSRHSRMRERIQYRRVAERTSQRTRNFEAGLIDISVSESTDRPTSFTVHNCGALDVECQYCKAKFFCR